jgi:protein-tyrosine phosphatase
MRRFGPAILVPHPGNTDDMDGSLQSAISSDMQLNHDLLTERPARQSLPLKPPP